MKVKLSGGPLYLSEQKSIRHTSKPWPYVVCDQIFLAIVILQLNLFLVCVASPISELSSSRSVRFTEL
ncbi:uncharacterized protein LAESUDRAFT_721239 [Laetiporus sulphureus 93-53]|uniref:Uncharacterized protein n=1 Tax=Laetiporus sulphureus 93-53 TaxID=1314785 RepID=A0A165GUY5_9APHY|nr:uncharacterized protein LAESUDRAFT_721239 [Laetiporus sulphureus 93-53]KZT10848.1 hypothetical protein LAESUDRAFT_721239 [Laetiporus sulphureus 93-53]